MPPRTCVVRLQWHLVDHGLWCDRCLLPSVYRLALQNIATLTVVLRLEVCDDCGHQERLP
jgi:hypothetical protein